MHRKPEKSEALVIGPTRASSDVTQATKQGFNMSDSTQVSASRAITVPFHGMEIALVEHEGQPFTPMKALVSSMGLSWSGQFEKMKENAARWGIRNIRTPSEGGEQEVVGLPLRKLPGWLATLEPKKMKSAETAAKVVMFQDECDDVLWQYWNEGIVVNPRAAYSVNPGDKLTKEEADTLRQMVEGMAKKLTSDTKVQGKFIMQAWSKLKTHFKVSYRDIPRHELTEAVSIVNRHTVEWEVVDEEPKPDAVSLDRLDTALAMAGEVAAVAHRHVMRAVLAGEDASWDSSRWVFMFNLMDPRFSRGNGFVKNGWAKRIAHDVIVESPQELAESIRLKQYSLKDHDLAAIASACMQRLEIRCRNSPAVAH